LSIVLAFLIAMSLGLPLVSWLGTGPFASACIGYALYLGSLLFFWFALDGLGRK
jgi:hypothetical protein